MALELQRDDRSGVVSSAKYDYYWPGFEDSAPLGHNTVCLLTEVASVNVASPITVPADRSARRLQGTARLPAADQLSRSVARRPLDAARHRRLRPERGARTAVRGERRTASTLVQNFYEMGRRAVDSGREGGPFAFIIPPEQHDPYTAAKLEELLLAGRRRNSARDRAVPRRRRSVSGRHRHHLPGAAVSRLREDAARATELSGATGDRRRRRPSGRTMSPDGRCRCRWA